MNRNPEEIIEELLEKRGITDEQVPEFLSDRPKTAHDPFLLPDMQAGVDLILSEIDKGTKICIYGDYDADGVTSVCILYTFLKNLTDDLTYYIPSRFTDGYGLNNDALRRIKEEGAGLVITVDCGSVSYREVEYAKSIGLKVIVTDHHTVGDVRADSILINPKRSDSEYPFRELAGCGVAFKLAQALKDTAGLPKKVLNDCLDFVAIGTVADIVPLKDENRTMVKYGLDMINRGTRMSIRKLVEGISLQHVYSENISFGIGPHINAAGRMANADEAVKLFLAEDEQTAVKQTEALKEVNGRRKKLQEDAFGDCIEDIGTDDDFICLYKKDMHEGISGIVAGKLKEEFYRPCVILTSTDDGRIKGTGRSIESIDLHDFLKEFGDLFLTFGGHKGACGFTLESGNMEDLIAGIKDKASRMRAEDPELFSRKEDYDILVDPGELTLELYSQIKRMEPFGEGNRRPILKLENVTISNIRYMGSESQHVKFLAAGEHGSVECILFKKAAEYEDLLKEGASADVLGFIDVNSWRGNDKVQFKVGEIIRS